MTTPIDHDSMSPIDFAARITWNVPPGALPIDYSDPASDPTIEFLFGTAGFDVTALPVAALRGDSHPGGVATASFSIRSYGWNGTFYSPGLPATSGPLLPGGPLVVYARAMLVVSGVVLAHADTSYRLWISGS